VHWLFDPQLTQSTLELPAAEAKHARSLRLSAGEEVVITNGAGLCVSARMVNDVSYEVIGKFEIPQPKTRFHLVQALAKSDRDEMALQAACELGVSSVTPWESARSIVKWDGKADKNQERWQQIALSAMKQSQQAWLPTVLPLTKTKQLSPKGLGLVLVPGANNSLQEVDLSQDEITLVVGPEGGLTDQEVAQLVEQGFTPVRLGSSVLRTSTAGPAAIAALQLAIGNWN
jgi:16S rRNA (uracil1498-N3)-methyltransferase